MRVFGEGNTSTPVSTVDKEDSTSTPVKAVDKDRRKPKPQDGGPPSRECGNCGRRHDLSRRDLCPAFGKRCSKCRKLSHFAAKCRSSGPPSVHPVMSTDHLEIFQTYNSHSLDDSQLVTLRVESGSHIRFQVDTGAQCNVLPLSIYRKATKDKELKQMNPSHKYITAYGGTTIPVLGTVLLHVWRNDFHCLLDCTLVDRPDVRPLLGRKACLGMRIVSYLDNDQLHRPEMNGAPVYSVGEVGPLSKFIEQYPTVFGEGVGRLDEPYHIRLDGNATPVQHPPRRVPVPLRETLRHTLDDLTCQGIIAPVQQPTRWVSSMVIVPKKNGTLRICLDLNRAILREHYPLPTVEDVATRLHGARVFSVLDVSKGFWHIELDEPSSYLTTFNTPFGRYRWLRMPFGISSAPEVFQRRMHEVIEGLKGVEVVADDFMVVGYGQSHDEAVSNHDANLASFLQRCSERDMRLNPDKVRLRLTEVPFIGHVATNRGLRADPAKVKAIRDMPPPMDVAGVQRFLGMMQYLSKFLPRLSDMTKPLRDLTQKETEWVWEQPQQEALDALKQAVASTPVLRYYALQDEVTLQCDASQYGLGAALLQKGQPVAYASRALTPAETRYAQIEKELLAIVFACDRFEVYIFGRSDVNVETDHQPLEMITRKPLNSAPKRLQRMLLQLQKYSLNVHYKKGKHMYLADTLSRAYLPEQQVGTLALEVAQVDHTLTLALPQERVHQLQHASADDPVLCQLRKTIQLGWPDSKSDVPELLRPYYDFRDELTVQGPLVFKGAVVIVPSALRKGMMAACHDTHIGIEGCIRRARESIFWPRMAAELKAYISKCDVCMAHRASTPKETLMPHEFLPRPWSKVGADICELQGRMLLVVCDYFSNYIEVEKLQTTTTKAVVKALMTLYARYGVPDTLVTDNGPQFSSAEFATFSKAWGLEHKTSSPHYPQSNGKAENAVKTVKRLFTKCQEVGQSEYRALLDWRNTPTEGVGTSPAQRFLGRRCKTLLPLTHSQLQPHYPTAEDAQAIQHRKWKQSQYYNRHGRDLPAISKGETVRMRLPGETKWTPGICIGRCSPRSYRVRVGDKEFRRNRRQLIHTQEPYPQEVSDSDTATGMQLASEDSGETREQTPIIQEPTEPVTPPLAAAPGPVESEATTPPLPRRSVRARNPPDWFTNYVPA